MQSIEKYTYSEKKHKYYENEISKRFYEEVIELVDVGVSNLFKHF